MSRQLPAECNTPKWNRRMHDFAVTSAVGQAHSVIRQYYETHIDVPYKSDFDILRERFEWHDQFIRDVLAERRWSIMHTSFFLRD